MLQFERARATIWWWNYSVLLPYLFTSDLPEPPIDTDDGSPPPAELPFGPQFPLLPLLPRGDDEWSPLLVELLSSFFSALFARQRSTKSQNWSEFLSRPRLVSWMHLKPASSNGLAGTFGSLSAEKINRKYWSIFKLIVLYCIVNWFNYRFSIIYCLSNGTNR